MAVGVAVPNEAEHERDILATIDTALEYHQGQVTLLLTAKHRMAGADARLKLMASEP